MYNNNNNPNTMIPNLTTLNRGPPPFNPASQPPPPPMRPFQQIHPAFQSTSQRYLNPPQQPLTEFNASAMSPMFYGYVSTPYSKL